MVQIVHLLLWDIFVSSGMHNPWNISGCVNKLMLKEHEEFYLYYTVIMYIMGLQLVSSQKVSREMWIGKWSEKMFPKHDNLHFLSNHFWHRHGLAVDYILLLVLKLVVYSFEKVEEIFQLCIFSFHPYWNLLQQFQL